MGKGNRNPANKFKKGQPRPSGAGRKPGQPNELTTEVRALIRQAAEETGYIASVPVLDDEGDPTGEFEEAA
jgi:hypothetical protein